MIKSGLTSITFRNLAPEEIISLTLRGGLDGIEWGGDIHVPHGDIKTAREVRKMTLESGLEISSYGSYYKAAASEKEGFFFTEALDSAVELGAPTIRVWAGKCGSKDADSNYRASVIKDLKHISKLALTAGITVSLEYHGGTLTDTNESAIQLKKELEGSGVLFYWQPPVGESFGYCNSGLLDLEGLVSNIHVFHWSLENGNVITHSLEDGVYVWKKYLNQLAKSPKKHYALLEFVKDNKEEQFLEDAATLKNMLNELS
jgi:sugar phosphate isomerase/epimerase